MNNFLLTLLLLLGSQAFFAQSTELSDEAALKILESIQKEYESYVSHKFDFDVLMEYPGQEGEQMKGSLMQKGDMFNLDVSDRNIISDMETVWVYLKDRNTVEINDADFEDETNIMSPSYLFDLYHSDEYVFAVSSNSYEEGKAITQIECKPKDDESEYSKLRLTIEDKSNDVKRVKLFYKDGSRMTMKILAHAKGYAVTDSDFSFDPSKYEGIIEEDLRF